MKPTFVVDCSVVMAWCFADESSPEAERVLQRLENEWAIVPDLCHLETLNVLLIAERKKRISRVQTQRLLTFLGELPIATDTGSVPTRLPAILDLGRSLGVTSYGAAYIELAVRLGLPLATLDRQMRGAARTAGVPLLIRP